MANDPGYVYCSKKKPKKPKPYPKAWVMMTFAVLAFSLASCATYKVAKEEIAPKVKDAIIAAGPHLGEAIISDVLSLIGKAATLPEEGAKAVGIISEEKSAPKTP